MNPTLTTFRGRLRNRSLNVALLESFRTRLQNAKRTWVSCPGFDDFQVSSLGEVRRVRPRERMMAATVINGFPSVTLNGRRRTVARLVAQAFLPERLAPSMFVGYLDGDRLNVRAENLIWYFRRESPAERAAARELHRTGKRVDGLSRQRLDAMFGH